MVLPRPPIPGPRLSEPLPEFSSGLISGPRGGPQIIPRPAVWRPVSAERWNGPGRPLPERISTSDVRRSLEGFRPASVDPEPIAGASALDGDPRTSAVLCALFDEGGQAQVLLTRRSSRLRSHSHQVAFPGGRVDGGESLLDAALREATEEVGLNPDSVEVIGRLSPLRTMVSPAAINPFVGVLPARPALHPNPAEVERAFTVPLVELPRPDVHRQELWDYPDEPERPMHFFELVGDTVWGATARMLCELLDLLLL
jgi:8-oxo-dGTP pyrophosphatase MutT (NUDIX family)